MNKFYDVYIHHQPQWVQWKGGGGGGEALLSFVRRIHHSLLDFLTKASNADFFVFWDVRIYKLFNNSQVDSDLRHHGTRVAHHRHDDVIKWKHFPCYWPFVRGIYRSPINSSHKDQCHGALMFSLICTWINGWVNTREAGDLRCHNAHYGVAVMVILIMLISFFQIYTFI